MQMENGLNGWRKLLIVAGGGTGGVGQGNGYKVDELTFNYGDSGGIGRNFAGGGGGSHNKGNTLSAGGGSYHGSTETGQSGLYLTNRTGTEQREESGGGSYVHPDAMNIATSDGKYNKISNHNGPIQNLNSWNEGHGKVIITYLGNN